MAIFLLFFSLMRVGYATPPSGYCDNMSINLPQMAGDNSATVSIQFKAGCNNESSGAILAVGQHVYDDGVSAAYSPIISLFADTALYVSDVWTFS
jgi:hypothetical protein